MPGTPLAGDLDRGFIGLGARVAEEDTRRECELDQALRELDLWPGEVQVGRVDQLRRLLRDRRHHVGM